MRAGGEYFTQPAEPTQRRYEALRAYFVDALSAVEVGDRFGYSPQVVHQMASELRAGKAQFFHSSKPGPKGPRKAGRIRDRVLVSWPLSSWGKCGMLCYGENRKA